MKPNTFENNIRVRKNQKLKSNSRGGGRFEIIQGTPEKPWSNLNLGYTDPNEIKESQ